MMVCGVAGTGLATAVTVAVPTPPFVVSATVRTALRVPVVVGVNVMVAAKSEPVACPAHEPVVTAENSDVETPPSVALKAIVGELEQPAKLSITVMFVAVVGVPMMAVGTTRLLTVILATLSLPL